MEYLPNRFEEEQLPEDENIHETIKRLLADENEKALFFSDLTEALIGIARQQYKTLPVFDYDKCIEIFMERDGMTYEEATEHMSYNTEGSWVGENTPLIVHREELLTPQEPVLPDTWTSCLVAVDSEKAAKKFIAGPSEEKPPVLKCPLGAEDYGPPDELE